MKTEDFLSDNFLKQFKTVEQLSEFLNSIQKRAVIILTAPTQEAAAATLNGFEQKWGDKYAYAIRSWSDNWEELTVLFDFPITLFGL